MRVKKLKLQKGVKIKAEKGLNFPDSNFKIDILTEKDKEDLDFVCDHADIIGCSFVKDSEDIILIQEEIRKRLDEESAQKISLMVKMETVQGVQTYRYHCNSSWTKSIMCHDSKRRSGSGSRVFKTSRTSRRNSLDL